MVSLAIQTRGLTRDFAAVRAVDDLSLEVEAGTVFGFLGPNGAGKTTTIRLLLGLLDPTRGHAEVLGFDTRTEGGAIRERCGALLEHAGLYERLSAEMNLEYYARIWRLPPDSARARIRELLDHLDLWERRGDRVGTWSRGMKQKLAVARALLHHPALVFLDEPTAGLDPVAASALRENLATLAAQEGVTVFLTTHNLAEAEKLCHRVAVIREGSLIAVGTPDELRAMGGAARVEIVGSGFDVRLLAALRAAPEVARVDPENGRLVVDVRSDARVAPLVRLLVEGGAEIEEVRRGRASLEEAFLSLVESKS